jgi:hypothetical protein
MTLFDPPPAEPEWNPPSLQEAHGLWRTRDERVLPIAEMSASHLRGAIALFTKFGYGDHPKLDELRSELACRAAEQAPAGRVAGPVPGTRCR